MAGTRRTRAHPSPGGLQELPPPTRKPRRPRNAPRAANEVAFAPMPSEEPTAQSTTQQPSITSRSQSPVESRSASPPLQQPESRSTSPPNQHSTRSMSPTNRDTIDEPKRSTKAATMKRTRVDDKAGEQRPAKRARGRKTTRAVSQSHNENDSSSDVDEARPLALPTVPYNEDSSEDDRGESSQGARASPNNAQQRRLLTPKSARQKSAKQAVKYTPANKSSSKKEMMTTDMRERERIYEERYGRKMPVIKPALSRLMRDSIAHYGPRINYEEEAVVDSEDDLDGDFMDGPDFTAEALKNWKNDPKKFRRENFAFELPPQSTDSPEVAAKIAARSSKPRPSTTHSKSTNLVLTASRPEENLVLTRVDVIDATRSLVKWAERDESHRVPTPSEMEALLESFHAQEQAKISASITVPQLQHAEPGPVTPTSRTRSEADEALDNTAEVADHESLAEEVAEEVATPKSDSEVVSRPLEPQTPTPTVQQPQESRGFWNGLSAIKNIVATPLYYFGRRSHSADAATTNSLPVTSDFSSGPSRPLPRTSILALQSTPSRLGPRPKLGAQTERRGHKTAHYNSGPQTERRVRADESEKPPIHLRGLLSPSRIAEIHREQDRKKQRESHANRVEDETDIFQTAQVGDKRKRPEKFRTPAPAVHSGTFRVPSPESSDDDTDEEDALENMPIPGSFSNFIPLDYSPIASSSVNPSYDDRFLLTPDKKKWPLAKSSDPDIVSWRQDYAYAYNIPLYQVPDDTTLWHWHNKLMSTERQLEYANFVRNKTGREPKISESEYLTKDKRQINREKISCRLAGRPFVEGLSEENRRRGYTPSDYFTFPENAAEDRLPPYTGSIAKQPQYVQDNIDQGVHPLTPRSWTPRQPLFSSESSGTPPQSPINQKPLWPKKEPVIETYRKMMEKGLLKNAVLATPTTTQPSAAPPAFSTSFGSLGGSTPNAVDTSAATPTITESLGSLGGYAITRAPSTPAPNTLDASATTPTVSMGSLGGYAVTKATPTSAPNAVGTSSTTPAVPALFGSMGDVAATHAPSTPTPTFSSRTYKFPEVEDGSDDDEEIGAVKDQSADRASGQSTQAADTSVLQQKQWTQTPPPKPRPVNAQLPQQVTQQSVSDAVKLQAQPSAIELAKARAEKFKPAKSSGLRNVTQMSPLQVDQENRISQSQGQYADEHQERARLIAYFSQRITGFSQEVLDAVYAIPEEEIIATEIPAHLWAPMPRKSEVEKEVDRYFT